MNRYAWYGECPSKTGESKVSKKSIDVVGIVALAAILLLLFMLYALPKSASAEAASEGPSGNPFLMAENDRLDSAEEMLYGLSILGFTALKPDVVGDLWTENKKHFLQIIPSPIGDDCSLTFASQSPDGGNPEIIFGVLMNKQVATLRFRAQGEVILCTLACVEGGLHGQLVVEPSPPPAPKPSQKQTTGRDMSI